METVKGTVESIIFHNLENGYCVFSFALEDAKTKSGVALTCVGNLPFLSEGETLELTGEFKNNPKYGEQFVISGVTVTAPKTRESIIRYLSSGLLPGVGTVTARSIYAQFGDSTMEVIEKTPLKLSKVHGISLKKAKKISEAFGKVAEMQEQIIFLQGLNLSLNLSTRIYNVYKNTASLVVKENPYRLIDDVDGVGFITADKIAQNAGIEQTSPFRIRAALTYALRDSGDKQGNTYLTKDELFERAQRLVNLDFSALASPPIGDILATAELDGALKTFEDAQGRQCVALTQFYNREKAIASMLVGISHRSEPPALDCEALLAEFERIENIVLHPSQRAAVLSAVRGGACVITGGPGTGKTTIVRAINHILSYEKGIFIEFCSPTGRAAKRLTETVGCGIEAKTIHRMLGFSFADGRFNFTYNAQNRLTADVVIIDELSMVDVSIMHSLLRALKEGVRLIMVGDKDQLPSVGAGNVLGDIIKSGVITVNCLTHIYRQSEGSHIISNAHLINNKKMPVLTNKSEDFFFVECASVAAMPHEIVSLVSSRLPGFLNCAPSAIQVIAPLKGGAGGVDACNAALQLALNPQGVGKRQIRLSEFVMLREGDRVMQTVNDYSTEWVKIRPNGTIEDGQGVFNGDIGTAVQIQSDSVEVVFEDGRSAQYTANELVNLQLAYAMTVHKSQGSEFEAVVIALSPGPPTIINKNLLYTAVTRAKRAVIILGSKKVLSMAAHTDYIAQRNTLLADFLIEEKRKYLRLYMPAD